MEIMHKIQNRRQNSYTRLKKEKHIDLTMEEHIYSDSISPSLMRLPTKMLNAFSNLLDASKNEKGRFGKG